MNRIQIAVWIAQIILMPAMLILVYSGMNTKNSTTYKFQRTAVRKNLLFSICNFLWMVVCIVSCVNDYLTSGNMIAYVFFFIDAISILILLHYLYIPSIRKFRFTIPFNFTAVRYYLFMCERTSDFFKRLRNYNLPTDLVQTHCNDCGYMVVIKEHEFQKYEDILSHANVDDETRIICLHCLMKTYASRYAAIESKTITRIEERVK